jgi:hypothetical protein
VLQSFQRGFVPALIAKQTGVRLEPSEFVIDLTFRSGRETVSACFAIDRALALSLVSIIDGGAGLSVDTSTGKGLAHEIAIGALRHASGKRGGR